MRDGKNCDRDRSGLRKPYGYMAIRTAEMAEMADFRADGAAWCGGA